MNRIVLITGASGGLGSEIAFEYSYRGHDVVLVGRNEPRLALTQNDCLGRTFREVRDLRNTSLLDVLEKYRVTDIVMCAGVHYTEKIMEWENEIETNALAAIRLFNDGIFAGVKNFVHINSLAGKLPAAQEPVYVASKHAMTGFLQSMRLKHRTNGVRVLDVFISAIKTQMTAERCDQDLLIQPKQAASVIVRNALDDNPSLMIEELHIGRFQFPIKS